MDRYEIMTSRLEELLEQPDDGMLNEYVLTLRPADVAFLFTRVTEEAPRRRVFDLLTPEAAARVIEESRLDVQKALLRNLETERIRSVLEEMSSDDLADLVGSLGAPEAGRLLELIPDEAAEIRQLMAYPEESAGG